ncbi:MAG TPA: hypothetical protein VFG60_02905 [Burkholderiaceae bacterium]|nr:hypothetical protein [Burkholderiaceae bacterium]
MNPRELFWRRRSSPRSLEPAHHPHQPAIVGMRCNGEACALCQPDHRGVGAQYLAEQPLDFVLAGMCDHPLQKFGTKTLTLPPVGHDQRELTQAVVAFGIQRITRLGDADGARTLAGQRQQCKLARRIDAHQHVQPRRGQLAESAVKALVARRRRQITHEVTELLVIVGSERAQHDRAPSRADPDRGQRVRGDVMHARHDRPVTPPS